MKVSIDKTGRVVLPKTIRDEYGLAPGTVLDVEEGDEVIVLRPSVDRPNVREKEGLLVIVAEPSEALSESLDRSREDRLDRLSSFASDGKKRK